jgi:hypothetical protein
MANNATYGFESRFAFVSAGNAMSGATRFEVVESTVGKQGEILDAQGVLGVRTRREDRTRAGLVRVGGQLVLEPSLRMADFFTPYVLGAEETSPPDAFPVADTLPGFDMMHDLFTSGTSAIKYGELYVNRATLRFAPGMLRWTLDLIGKTATTGQTFPSVTLGTVANVDDPLVFHDCASNVSLKSTTVEIDTGELVIDNHLDAKFRNSQTATSIRATDRTVMLSTTIPLTSSLLTTFFGDKAAATATIILTRAASHTWTITLYNLKNPDQSPRVSGHNEVPLILESHARSDGTNPDVKFDIVGTGL